MEKICFIKENSQWKDMNIKEMSELWIKHCYSEEKMLVKSGSKV